MILNANVNETSNRMLHTFARAPLLLFLLWLVLILIGPYSDNDFRPEEVLYQVHAFSMSRTRVYSSITTNNHRRIRQEYRTSSLFHDSTTTTTANPRESSLLFLHKDDCSINDSHDHHNHTTTSTNTTADENETLVPPPLTTVMKQRRMQEIQLLKELEYSDDAIPSLWKLWSMEKGPPNAVLLLQAEQYMSTGEFELAQQLLQSLIQTHGIHWAEPMNKLATLYYMTGQHQKSKELCLLVLQVKPWHFGALSGIVLVCTAMKDVTGARFWADRRLPPMVPIHTSGDRRSQWVQRAVQDAKERLDRAVVENAWNIGTTSKQRISWNEMDDVERNSSWQ
jgi:hypothetical protein